MTLAPDPTADEDEVRRRLAALAATTTVDPGAWDEIQRRIARPEPPRRRLVVVAAAAAAAVLIVVLTLVAGGDDGSRVRTDDTTTTTEGDRDTTTTTTATTLPVAPPDPGGPVVPGPDAGGGAAPTSPGAGPAAGGGGTAGRPAGGTAPGGTPAPGGATTPEAPAPAPPGPVTAPDGKVPAVTYPTSDFDLQITTSQNGGNVHLDLWRADVGYIAMYTGDPGTSCVGGLHLAVNFPDATRNHWAGFGVVRADAAAVRLVSAGGQAATAGLGAEVAPGYRPWLGEVPGGELARIEVLGPGGELLVGSTVSSSTFSAC